MYGIRQARWVEGSLLGCLDQRLAVPRPPRKWSEKNDEGNNRLRHEKVGGVKEVRPYGQGDVWTHKVYELGKPASRQQAVDIHNNVILLFKKLCTET